MRAVAWRFFWRAALLSGFDTIVAAFEFPAFSQSAYSSGWRGEVGKAASRQFFEPLSISEGLARRTGLGQNRRRELRAARDGNEGG
jgi:hypothetical protein